MPDQTDTDSGSAEPAKHDDSSDRVPEAAKRRPGKARRPGKTSSKPKRWPLLAAAAAVIAAVVAGIALTGWLRPSGHFSSQQTADAKKEVCTAAALARQAVAKNMHLKNPDPENPLAQLAVAANARLSLTGAAAYLRGQLDQAPAAPQDVADGARAMAAALEHLNVSYLAGQPNSEHDQLGHDLDSRITALGKLCE